MKWVECESRSSNKWTFVERLDNWNLRAFFDLCYAPMIRVNCLFEKCSFSRTINSVWYSNIVCWYDHALELSINSRYQIKHVMLLSFLCIRSRRRAAAASNFIRSRRTPTAEISYSIWRPSPMSFYLRCNFPNSTFRRNECTGKRAVKRGSRTTTRVSAIFAGTGVRLAVPLFSKLPLRAGKKRVEACRTAEVFPGR